MRLMKKLTIFLACALVGGLACADESALKDMELSVLKGVVNVIRDGETIPVESTIGLEPGDVVETKQGTIAKFALDGGPDERRGELQGSTKIMIRSATSIEAEEGQLLLAVQQPTTVVVDSVTARTAGGTFRIDRGFGSDRAGVYSGSLDLDAPGQPRLRLDTLFQATMVAGDLPSQGRPYRLDESDAWDQRVLGEVVDLEQQLEVLARGLTPQLRGQRPNLDYFEALIGGGNVSFMRGYLQRKPVDLLIGFTIARNASLELEKAFRWGFRLYDQGARWGVAAKIMEVEPRPVVAQLERLILGTGVVAADGSGQPADFSVAAAAASETGGSTTVASTDGSDPTTTGGGNDPGSGDDGGGDDKPNEKPTPEESPDECSNSTECTVNDILGQRPSPSPSPSSEEQGDKSGSLLDGLD
ncbi:MAG: hypothetical protein ACLGIB_01725 [Actinomycetota bacterium]